MLGKDPGIQWAKWHHSVLGRLFSDHYPLTVEIVLPTPRPDFRRLGIRGEGTSISSGC